MTRMSHKKSTSARGLVLLVGCFASPAAWAATSGANGTHDPSRMIVSNGRFYVYSTGGGSKSSLDGLAWTAGPSIFPNGIPQSATSVVSSNEGVWAPDVIYLNNQYYLYYAIANAQNACAVGLITSPTLDPSAPGYKWTDRGVVVSNSGSATYCAIDPCPVLDADGNLWLSWGSGYTKSSSDNTIYVTRLDNATGLVSSADTAAPGHPLEPGHIEASYLYYHAGFYYLFWNSGGCCSGASSTYEIHVARAQSITGPYTGSKIFYQSAGSIHGPGQIGIYDQCGASRFTYHYYPDTGGSVLGENELGWTSDGWPAVGISSTTPLTPCPAQGTGGATGSGAGGSTGSGGSSGRAGSGGGGSVGGSGGRGGSGGGTTGGQGGRSSLGGADGRGAGGGDSSRGGRSGDAGSDRNDAGGALLGEGGASGGSGGGMGVGAGGGGSPGSPAQGDGGPSAAASAGCSCDAQVAGRREVRDLLLLAGILLFAIRRRRPGRAREG